MFRHCVVVRRTRGWGSDSLKVAAADLICEAEEAGVL